MTAAVNTRERDKREESFGLLLSFVCSCFLSLSLLAKHSWLAQSTNSLQSSWSARSARTTVLLPQLAGFILVAGFSAVLYIVLPFPSSSSPSSPNVCSTPICSLYYHRYDHHHHINNNNNCAPVALQSAHVK